MVANIAPRKMKFGVSEGMVLAASGEGPGLFPPLARHRRATGDEGESRNGCPLVAARRLAARRRGLARRGGRRTDSAGNAGFARRFAFPLGAAAGVALAAFGLQAVWLPPQILTAAARAARSALPSAYRPARGIFPDAARFGLGRHLPYTPPVISATSASGRLTAHQPAIPRFPREHGLRPARRRRIPLHGRLGNDGALAYFLVTTDHQQPAIRSAGSSILLIAHLGANRDLALLRRSARGPRRLHVRRAGAPLSCSRRGRRWPPASAFFGSAPRRGSCRLSRVAAGAHPPRLAGVGADERHMLKTAFTAWWRGDLA